MPERLPFNPENIGTTTFEEELQSSFLDYAMSVIAGRAIPELRDGLKPVQLRILYAMYRMGVTPDKPAVKCARIVGEVMGNYHPHGDQPIYEALVRMAQDFNMRYPLIEGTGNFGSIDGDPPAAQRYTEARLAPIALELLQDIDRDTVDWRPNFDGSKQEPIWLPARIPNLLMNGSAGVAVGLATSIPPHNLTELCDALLLLLRKPEATLEEILEVLPGPDFPTGGLVGSPEAIRAAYATGHGTIRIRARIRTEEIRKRRCLVITEIPYAVKKADILTRIAELIQQKRLHGIQDIRDETDRKGIRIVLELTRDAHPEVVIEELFRYTQLETTFNVLLLALDAGVPRLLSLPEMLLHFLEHRRETLRRRARHDLRKAKERLHILEGLRVALENLDAVIRLIRGAAAPAEAREQLMKQFRLSEAQAKAILEMRLSALTRLEREKLEQEMKEKQEIVRECEEILRNPAYLDSLIARELEDLRSRYGDPRRSEITSWVVRDLREILPPEEVVVTLSAHGYIKRTPLEAYRLNRRGVRGILGMEVGRNDWIRDILVARTDDRIFAFSRKGKVFAIDVWDIPTGDRRSRGVHINNLIRLPEGDAVLHILKSPATEQQLVLLTRQGYIKRTRLPAQAPIRRTGKQIITLEPGDEVIAALWATAEDIVVLVTAHGKAVAFHVDGNLRLMSAYARGVRGIRLREGDEVVGATLLGEAEELLVLTRKGYGKLLPVTEIRVFRNRGGAGILLTRVTPRTGPVLGIRAVPRKAQLITITQKGKLQRQDIAQVSQQKRYARGVRLVKLAEDDELVNFDVVESENHEDNGRIPGKPH